VIVVLSLGVKSGPSILVGEKNGGEGHNFGSLLCGHAALHLPLIDKEQGEVGGLKQSGRQQDPDIRWLHWAAPMQCVDAFGR
jgi:hypothetical protein